MGADIDIQKIADHIAIIDTVNGVAISADKHDWDGAFSCFDEEVAVDYTSLAWENPALEKAKETWLSPGRRPCPVSRPPSIR
jgi:hypothetical protein